MNIIEKRKIIILLAIVLIAVILMGAVYALIFFGYFEKRSIRELEGNAQAQIFIESLKRIEKKPYRQWNAGDYLDLGNIYNNLQLYEKASFFYKKAAFNYGRSNIALINLANTEVLLGNFKKAEIYYLTSLDADSRQPELYIKLAELYQRSWRGKIFDSVSILQKGLASNKEHPNILISLAQYYQETGNRLEAIKYFKRSLMSYPDNQAVKDEIARLEAF
ncbi:hypothetical protein HYV44_03200 [Candidatus Microgenomates bacterium]|nr:hypothetical protein [Candidatus Microgenomates bacterium]